MKKIIVIGDLHCGSRCGLTPREWQWNEFEDSTTKRAKFATLQKDIWNNFVQMLSQNAPYDYLFSMGDCVDGKGTRSGGTELITADMDEQTDMAVACHAEVKKYANKGFKQIGVWGTAYHVSPSGEEWDKLVYDRCGFDKHGWHEWPEVYDTIFDLKHHISSSGVPYSRHTASSREITWGALWNERGEKPKADVYIRGHVHYAQYCWTPMGAAMTTPALQGMGSKYGASRMSGVVDWGFVVITVEKGKGKYEVDFQTKTINSQIAKVTKLI